MLDGRIQNGWVARHQWAANSAKGFVLAKPSTGKGRLYLGLTPTIGRLFSAEKANVRCQLTEAA